MTIFQVNVVITLGDTGLFFGMSEDLRGLLVTGQTEEQALSAVPDAIGSMYRAQGKVVGVSRVNETLFEVTVP